MTYLTNGIPNWDNIKLNQYKYYAFVVNDPQLIGIDLAITPYQDIIMEDDFDNNDENNGDSNSHNFPCILKAYISKDKMHPTSNNNNNNNNNQWFIII